MKIYTKTGDTGETSLVGGKRVSKASMRVCAYGDMDELISYIGLLRCEIPESDAFLRNVQAVLMTGSAHIASEAENPRLTPFPYEEIRTLEQEIDRLSALIPPMKSFILPAGPTSAAHCHIARCVCRRCERSLFCLYLPPKNQQRKHLKYKTLCIGHLNWPRSSKTLPGPQPKTN